MATDVRPHVLIIGGFLSSPPAYRALRGRLLARGAASVTIAPIWLPDWMLVWGRGQAPIATRAARALLAASRGAGGAPLLVIGHSAGGILAWILTSEAAFEGRRFAGAGRIGAIVTLGTPHVNAWEAWTSRRSGVYPTRFVEATVPGAYWAPRIGYLAVASRSAAARAGAGGPWERWLRRSYERLLPPPWPDVIEGDGVTPVVSALLPGARHITLDGAAHGQGMGRPWYGSSEWLDSWWPAAVETWLEALDVRAGMPEAGSVATAAPPPGQPGTAGGV